MMPNWPSVSSPESSTVNRSLKSMRARPRPCAARRAPACRAARPSTAGPSRGRSGTRSSWLLPVRVDVDGPSIGDGRHRSPARCHWPATILRRPLAGAGWGHGPLHRCRRRPRHALRRGRRAAGEGHRATSPRSWSASASGRCWSTGRRGRRPPSPPEERGRAGRRGPRGRPRRRAGDRRHRGAHGPAGRRRSPSGRSAPGPTPSSPSRRPGSPTRAATTSGWPPRRPARCWPTTSRGSAPGIPVERAGRPAGGRAQGLLRRRRPAAARARGVRRGPVDRRGGAAVAVPGRSGPRAAWWRRRTSPPRTASRRSPGDGAAQVRVAAVDRAAAVGFPAGYKRATAERFGTSAYTRVGR